MRDSSERPRNATVGREARRKQDATSPSGQDTLLQAAVAAHQRGQLAEAESLCREILALQPHHLPATHLLGILAGQTSRPALAIELLSQVVTREPHSIVALNQLAALLRVVGRAAEAVPLCRQAIRLDSNNAGTYFNLGLACLAERQLAEATASLMRATALNPRLAGADYHLGIALHTQNRNEEAAAAYRRAIVLDPQDCDAYRKLGIALQQLGQFDEAIACFARAISVQPRRTASYTDLFYSKKASEADRPLIMQMVSLLREAGLTDQDRANLHFALGKAFDDLADYESAIRHIDEANRLKRPISPFDRKRHAAAVDWLIAAFTPEFFARHASFGSQSELPLLIVGMPRSGTTLVEQIVSSHSEITGGDELTFWEVKAAALAENGTDQLIAAVTARQLADDYLMLLRGISSTASRVTDKMPHNFLRLGLIHLVFPRARIIHCSRNPVDTCLSIYFTQFTHPQNFAYDRGDIVFFYEQYLRLMAHWRSVLPADRFLEVDYEELVTDRERVTRQMIGFCGLAWDDSCLHHEINDRVVKTASLWQARQPVYKTSVERWRRYEPWLGEFRCLLPDDGREEGRRP